MQKEGPQIGDPVKCIVTKQVGIIVGVWQTRMKSYMYDVLFEGGAVVCRMPGHIVILDNHRDGVE